MTWIILGVVIFAAIVLMGRAHSRYLDRQEDLWKIYHALENGAPTKLNFMMKELKEVHQEQAVLAARTPEMMNRAFHHHIRYGRNRHSDRRRTSNRRIGTYNRSANDRG